MKKTLLLFGLLIILSPVFAQAPDGYYTSAENKSDSLLRDALKTIINNHTQISYSDLYTAYKTTDVNPTTGYLWDIYSNCNFTLGTDENHGQSTSSECISYNREHTTPQSWFGGEYPMYSDLYNVYPTDGHVNYERDNYPYGEVGTSTYTSGNGSKLGTSNFSGYSGTVFEPIDEYKGDLARTYFYMATCYADSCGKWTNGYGSVVYSKNNLGFTSYAINLFLKWNNEDPVNDKEINRNNVIYNNFQHNRNPFIDHPELAEYIWGNKKGETWTLSGSGSTDPTLYSPNSGSTVDFGTVIYQQNTTKTITVTGSNLTGDLNLTLSGNDASYFSIPVTTISKTDAQTGYNLTISYNAPVTGSHSAVLTISGGGITTTTVNLTATATDCSGLSFSVPFTTTISPFTEYSITGDQIWVNSYSSATMTGYVSSTNYANEDWLISPQIDFKDYNNLILAFDYVTRYFNDPVTDCTIWISDNYISGVPNTASWTQLNPPTPFFNASSWTFSPSGNIDLNAYKDQKVNIAFKYISTNAKAGTWEIQNLNITGDCNSTFVKDILNDNKHKVISENKNLHIFELKNEDIAIYNIYGIKLFYKTNASGNILINNLQTGIYIIRAGNDTQKAIVK